ncbi:hypothetical protein TNCV_171581 [Trichonephila clavipes]|nr:hypothetical protein TNCV_171581 [Trichonephila clavipes]
MMDRISICEALAKRNEIDSFLKRMATGDEKWVTYCNIVRKRSWSKCGETAQTMAKPGLTARKVLLCICNMRAFGDGPCNFEPWSSVVDDTGAGTSSPNYHTTPTGGRFCSRQI